MGRKFTSFNENAFSKKVKQFCITIQKFIYFNFKTRHSMDCGNSDYSRANLATRCLFPLPISFINFPTYPITYLPHPTYRAHRLLYRSALDIIGYKKLFLVCTI